MDVSNDNEDAISINSCDSDENQFTMLTGKDGTEYHPPSLKKFPSRYTRKGQGHTSGSLGDNSLRKLASLKSYMEKQNSEIQRLRDENKDTRKQLRTMKKNWASLTTTSKGPQAKKTSGSISAFMDRTLAQVLSSDNDNDSDIEELEDPHQKQIPTKPDSTLPKGFQKHSEESDEEEVPSSQLPVHKKRGRRHIESVSSDGKPQTEITAGQADVHENEDEVLADLQ